ncbi:MAG: adenylate/guanylate cyclase domain-containing protein [Candidatus Binataceae bacterium]
MSHRTKLFVVLISLVVITNGLLATVNYFQCDSLLRQEFHRKARSIASTASALIDPEAIKMIRHRGDEQRPEYALVNSQLRRIRDFNRREDVWIADIFTLIRAPQDPKVVEYGDDADQRFDYRHHLGDIYLRHGEPVTIGLEGINELAQRLSGFQAGYDAAFAPIKDKSGALVAMVGVTLIPAPYSVLRGVGYSMLAPFALTIALAIIFAAILSRSVTRPLEALRRQILEIGNGNFGAGASAPVRVTGEFGQMAAAIGAMATGLRERDTIKRAFSGYISRQVLDAIMEKGELPALKGERRRITVLFADIRGFTAIAEGMRPEEVVQLLSEFFDRMVEVILRHHGTIDKFLGDGMMVMFGAPLDDPYQEEHAVVAAVEMQTELRALCAKWETEGRRPIKMGIGINSGAAVVGNIGSEEHMEYTAIGDTVNLAARLETATKELGAEIIVSEQTYGAVRPLFRWKPAGNVTVRGRSEPVRAYSVESDSGLSAESA